jgi:DNA repair protein RadA/Sms
MVIAVLDARCGLNLAGQDVYLSVAGGLRISEPAADLAVAAALISSLAGVPAPEATLFFGEIGLSGAVRPVNGRASRLREAAKLGFTGAIVPIMSAGPKQAALRNFRTTEIKVLAELLVLFGYESRPQSGASRQAGLTTRDNSGNDRTGTI